MADNNRLHNKLALASCASMLEVLLNFCTYHLQPRNSSFKRFPSSSGANCQKMMIKQLSGLQHTNCGVSKPVNPSGCCVFMQSFSNNWMVCNTGCVKPNKTDSFVCYISPRALPVPSLWQQSLTKKLWNTRTEKPCFCFRPLVTLDNIQGQLHLGTGYLPFFQMDILPS